MRVTQKLCSYYTRPFLRCEGAVCQTSLCHGLHVQSTCIIILTKYFTSTHCYLLIFQLLVEEGVC